MINLTNIANTNAKSGVAEKPRNAGEKGEEFALELAQAGAVAANQPIQPLKPAGDHSLELSELGVELGKKQQEASESEAKVAQGAASVKPVVAEAANGSRSALHDSTIAKSELAQKSVAGMKTAAAVAGLKPWSKEWVFEGFEQPRPELKPLFSEKPEAAGKEELARMQSVGAQLKALFDAGMQVPATPETPAAQGATPVMKEAPEASLDVMRGDADPMPLQMQGLDAAGLNGAVEGVTRQPAEKKSGLTTQLSGSEFLTALNSVRQGGAKGAESQLSGDSKEGGSHNGAADSKTQTQLKGKPGLKVIRGGMENGAVSEQSRFATLMAAPTHPTIAPSDGLAPNVIQLSGQTAKGAGSRDRLSTDALVGLTGNIRNLGAQGNGEIRIRLKPENLGELHLRVVTRGNEVGLHIQASDDKAMKVIEESMGFLKDSLAAQNLSLGKVELAVAQSHGTGTQTGSGNEQAQQGHHGSQDLASMMGQDKGRDNRGQSEGWTSESAPAESMNSRARAASAGWSAAARTRSAAASGRLDVTA